MSAAFDDDFACPAEWGRMYRSLGIQIVPCYMPAERKNWKRPALADWVTLQHSFIPEAAFERWYGPRGEHSRRINMGMLTGACSGGKWVLDLDDHKTPQAALWWRGTLEANNNGEEPWTWQQRTGGGGRQLVFASPPGWTPPTNRTEIGVDIRGQGGFAVLAPSLHDSGNHYEWLPDRAPWETTIVEAPAWLCEAVDRLVADHGGSTHLERTESTASPGSDFNALGQRQDGREDYMTRLIWATLVSLHAECPIPPSRADMENAYQVYERSTKSRLYDPTVTKRDLLEREGRGHTLFAEKWRRALKKWGDELASEASDRKASEAHNEDERDAEEKSANDGSDLEEWTIGDRTTPIPPRPWLLGTVYCRGYISSTIAEGAAGKTSLEYLRAVSLCLGKSLSGDHIHQRCRVLIVCMEDDDKEVRRRIRALSIHYNFHESSLNGWIWIVCPKQIDGKLAHSDKNGSVTRGALSGKIERIVDRRKIDVVILDPFVKTHSVNENDNSMIDEVVQTLSDLASTKQVAISIPHHLSKGAADPGNANRARGASAMKDAARLVRSLTVMTAEEAQQFDLTDEQRRSLVRLDDAKVNIAPPASQTRWYRFVGVNIENGTDQYPNGDNVQAVETWEPPNAFSTLSDDMIIRILDDITRGMGDGEYYSSARSATNRAAWKIVVRHCSSIGEGAARRVINSWVKSGQLEKFTYQSPKERKEREGVRKGIPHE